jgi:hypothetical protein
MEPSKTTDTQLLDTIGDLVSLWNNYNTDEKKHVRDKIQHYITNHLPAHIKAYEETYQQREERKKSLETMSDEFIETFLHKNKFYYNHSIDMFFYYNDIKYAVINEDDIQHKILSEITAISNKTDLMPWKYKIKNQIIKKIKERELFKSIPESKTIQNVLAHLHPALFSTRDEAKYFLTVIGDVILKKNTWVYFITPKAKTFIKELGNECYALCGCSNFANTFKFKYYEHVYDECRLIDFNDAVSSVSLSASSASSSTKSVSPTLSSLQDVPSASSATTTTNNNIKDNIVDLICIACHYSQRFGCADDFLKRYCKTVSVKSHALFLKSNTEDQLLTKFINHTTEPCSNCVISWKNMMYLWKIYTEELRIPNVFFMNALKTKLAKFIEYSEGEDVFLNRTSKFLPLVSKFLTFWNDKIVINENDPVEELEIDELSTLFNQYIAGSSSPSLGAMVTSSSNFTSTSTSTYTSTFSNPAFEITDQILLELIRHFFPDVSIEDDKNILNVSCKMWAKKEDILTNLERYKDACITQKLITAQPLYNAYEFYCSQMYMNRKLAVSKRYFERFFTEYYGNYLDKEGLICVDWWDT